MVMQANVRIMPYRAVAADATARASIDAIFFGASGTQSFASEAERGAFRARWLGRFLDGGDADHAFVAVTESGVIGYLVGALDDPAVSGRFSDIGYFRNFANLTATYPAHLHINLAAEARNQGVGARLIEAFAAHAHAAGAAGMHVVTGAASRNVRFYAACGFAEAGRLETAKPIVFLGRRLNIRESKS
jgi:GNAT superfamily N-acetyltransferase